MQLLSDKMEQVYTLKNIKPTTKNIKQIRPIRHFFEKHKDEIKHYEMNLSKLKNPIQSCQIQEIF